MILSVKESLLCSRSVTSYLLLQLFVNFFAESATNLHSTEPYQPGVSIAEPILSEIKYFLTLYYGRVMHFVLRESDALRCFINFITL